MVSESHDSRHPIHNLSRYLPFHRFSCVVEHGVASGNATFMSLGFYFNGIAYISDISGISDASFACIEDKTVILILDMLRGAEGSRHKSHFCWDQSRAFIERLRPQKTYLVGMSHTTEHETMTRTLMEFEEKSGLWVRLAYDGLYLELNK